MAVPLTSPGASPEQAPPERPNTQPCPWIVVPAYQAEQKLGGVLERIPWAQLGGARLLVVDDGSRDRTGEIASRHGAGLLRNATNRGYAATQKRGIAHALAEGASAVVILHADGQYPPESLPEVIGPLLRNEADVVLGTRVADGGAMRRGMPRLRYMANRALTWIENGCYGLDLSEYHSGMMAYSRVALERLPFRAVSDSFHFDGEMAMLAGRRGLRIREIQIPHIYGDETSHLRPIPYVLTVLAIAGAVRLGLYDRWVARRAARGTMDEAAADPG